MEGVGMGTDVHVHNLPTTSHGFANKQMTAAAAARGKGMHYYKHIIFLFL